MLSVRGIGAAITLAPKDFEGARMFKLPAYDPTAIAMLGFGILAALSLPFIF
jgi:hypothetical protein